MGKDALFAVIDKCLKGIRKNKYDRINKTEKKGRFRNMNYEIAKDAIEDAIENRKIAGHPRDGGLDEALK